MFKGKTLLISGGTGSFGNAVVSHFLNSGLEEIRIFSRDEKKQDDMRRYYNNEKLKFYIGDVRDYQSVRNALHGVDFVFHAAALKQVPSCELFPMEAIKTNALGTNNVLIAAIDEGVKKVVCLSTDKAAYPINAMGISKAMMEKIMGAVARNTTPEKTTISCTRFGNVIASRGSVIPLFVDQIKEGMQLTVTNPNMTRFLMNWDEAVKLVLCAFKDAHQGDLFVQKTPAATISDLAQAVSELFNYSKPIKITGTRNGEKLYETLLTKEEKNKAIDLGNYFRVPIDKKSRNYDHYSLDGTQDFETIEAYTSQNTERLDVDAIKQKLLSVPFIRKELGLENDILNPWLNMES